MEPAPRTRTNIVRVSPEALRMLTAEVLRSGGLTEQAASHATEALIAADLRGVESHGVSNMLRLYVQWLTDGTVNPAPNLRLVREAPATMVFDADGGLGVAVAPLIMDEVISRASTYGIAFATVTDSRHLGMLAHPAMLALPHDMIGICATAGGPRMVPTFGREARLGTNPLAIAIPAGRRPPFVFDSASTVVPVNKLRHAARWGNELPIGLFLDDNGLPLSKPRVPTVDDPDHLAPLGSHPDTASHKGYGLAATIDLLCSILPGAPYGYKGGHNLFNHTFAALDVRAFNDVDDFKAEVDEFLDVLNTTPPARGHERVYYAGQQEAASAERRAVEGIPLHPEVIGWFREHCAERGIDASVLD